MNRKPSQPCAPVRLDGWSAFGATDAGRVRRENQDRFVISPHARLLAVADGMGGHAFGARASTVALERITASLARAVDELTAHSFDATRDADPDATVLDASLNATRVLTAALDDANATLHAINVREGIGTHRSMGTTVTGIWLPPGSAMLYAFHVGDSRLYRCRDGALAQLTRDQTLLQQALETGDFEHLPPRNMLLQALGPEPSITPEIRAHAARPGDRFLLCSDGLHGEVPHHEVERVLAQMQPEQAEAACRRLIELACDAGGKDNVTVVIACVEGG
ncbi:Serine/threonine phosphatase stp [Burkholderia sp. 8Y]|uniref:PP2C family protein-serine/threonine phosphatase n=1 Tax=Burkholderia sp. 8Y TaxID=2653133 RepID=UPI0012F3B8AE|nr:protein phosphatase 2C domain-containing protein [Burkholderia sp. 8Y]VXB13791.1 Serine/threonine phosphatase stp [Burkholderia sp. 8Y]